MHYELCTIINNTYQRSAPESKRPLIGITCNAEGEDYNIRQRYCQMVEASGGAPVLLAPTSDIEVMIGQLDMVDAIIFSGGGDHNPLWMGEQPLPQLHSINPVRDSHELLLCRLAFYRQIPMLGICRGMQTMAIALGGHVAQDIYTQKPILRKDMLHAALHSTRFDEKLIKHSQDAPKAEPTHSVAIAHGSLLGSIVLPAEASSETGCSTYHVNSFHHQSVDNPGDHFIISAVSPDGIAEAMESTEGKMMMAVQWHPEQMQQEGKALFDWLVMTAAQTFREAKALHSKILTIDSHCDTPMLFPQNVNFLSRDPRILYDYYKMQEGRIDAVTMACYLPQPKFGEGWKAPLEGADTPSQYADIIFDRIEQIIEKSGHRISLARTPAEVYRDKRHGRHSIMLAIENGLAIGKDLRRLEHFKNRGIVYMTLCHNGDNDICDSARGCQTHGGLSSFGREVVSEMNRLGIMIDLSHAAETSFYDALRYSSKPIVCSHSNCRALCDHPRNLTDQQMRDLANAGGVMQLTLYPGFIRREDQETKPLVAAKPSLKQRLHLSSANTADSAVSADIPSVTAHSSLLDDFLAHLDHAIEIMGIDHVGIGTDFDGDGGIPGLANASELINLTMHLLRRGFSHRDIEKIWGGNWMRVMTIASRSEE